VLFRSARGRHRHRGRYPEFTMSPLAERFARDLEGLTDLPSIPPAVAKLLATVQSPDVSLPVVADIIRTDPALAAQILRVANSAAYGLRVPAATIRDALLRLGFKEVRRLAVVLSLYSAAGSRGPAVDRDPRWHDTFWHHSLGVGHAAEIIASRSALARESLDGEGESLFLGGLFHDLGLLALATHYPDDYTSVRRAAGDSGAPFCAAEVEILLTDHGELGAQLAQRWRLPDLAVTAIRAHHRVELAPLEHQAAVSVLQMAEAVCHAAEIGDLEEGGPLSLEPGAASLGLSAAEVTGIVEATRAESQRSAAILGAGR